MKVVERYILQRMLAISASTLAWTLVMVWITQVLARINLVTDSGQSAATFFEIATMMLPSVVPVVIPFAVAIGVAHTLSTMNTDSELVVLGAAGSPRSTVIRPVILLAVAASILSFVIDNAVNPHARERFRTLLANARADLISSVIQEGTFRRVDEGLFIQIGERLPDGQLGGVFVADSREEGVDLAYYAKSAAVIAHEGNSILLMRDGMIHRKPSERPVSVVRFASYAFDLSAFSPASAGLTMLPKDRALGYLLDPDPDDPVFVRNPQLFTAELHNRFTEWLYPLVFALISLAAAGDARSYREARLHPLATAIGVALVVRWAGFFSVSSAETTAAFGIAIYAVPLVAALVAIGFIASNRTMELPVSFVERATAAARAVGGRISELRLRGGQPAGASGEGSA